MTELLAAIALGFAGGVVGGLLGVGGGILFVPTLTILLGHSQIEGEASSLVAIVPVAIAGTWRQARYGNVRLSDGIWIGALSLAGVIAGAVIANAVSQRALEIGFAGLLLFVAFRLAQGALTSPPGREKPAGGTLSVD